MVDGEEGGNDAVDILYGRHDTNGLTTFECCPAKYKPIYHSSQVGATGAGLLLD